MNSPGRPSISLWPIAVLAFVAAFSLMVYRGPMRALAPGGSSDFSLIWQSTRAFANHQSPYTVESIERTWIQSSGQSELPPSDRNAALLVYPPSTFVLMSPWCLSDWFSGRMGWMLTGTLLLLGSIAGCLRLAGLSWDDPYYWLAAAGGLAMATGHTSISVGQPALLVMFLIVLARLVGTEKAEGAGSGAAGTLAAGIALGLAAALKPQIGLPFIAYELYRFRWKTATIGGMVAVVILALGAWHLQSAGIDWLPQWRANLAALATSDNGSPTASNPLRHHLINLAYWLHTFTDSRSLVNALLATILAGLSLAFLFADRGTRRSRDELLGLSFVAAMSMLVVYHRLYDAVVLYFPLAYVAASLRSRSLGLWPRAMGVCLLPFFIPGAVILASKAVTGKLPASISDSWWYGSLVLPHAVIALVLLAACIIMQRLATRNDAASQIQRNR